MRKSVVTDERQGFPSCSELGRLMACPASFHRAREAAKRLKRKKTNEAAISGERIHAVLAGLRPESDLDMWEGFIATRCAELETGLRVQLGFEESAPNLLVLQERRLWWKPPELVKENEVNISGRTDKTIVNTSRHNALVLDYKTGRSEVQGAADNWQMNGYAWLEWYNDDRLPERLDEIFIAIIQPQADIPVTIARLSKDEMPVLQRRIEQQLERAANPHAKAHAGAHCVYCPANGSCHEAIEYVGSSLVPVDQVQIVQSGRKTEYIVPTLAPEEIVKYLDKKRILKAIMDGLDAQAKSYAADGLLPGYSLNDGKEDIEITNLVTAFKILREYTGIHPLLRCVSVSNPGLDEIMVLECGVPKSKARETWKELLAPVLSIGRTAPELVKLKMTKTE